MPLTYWLPPLVGAVMNGALAVFLLTRRTRPGTFALAGYLLAITEWSIGYFFQLRGATLADRVFWSKVQYLGVVCVPLFGLVFLLQYLGLRKWLTVRRLAVLCIIPAVAQLVVWTNEYHGLIWPKLWLDVSGPFAMLDRTHGLGFWVLFVYCYGLVVVSITLLITMLVRSQYLYRGQAAVLLIGCLTPVVANILYTFNIRPVNHLDLTVFGFRSRVYRWCGACFASGCPTSCQWHASSFSRRCPTAC